MKDRDFLIWLHARLINRHGEDPRVDYMHKLVAISEAMPRDQDTRPVGMGSFIPGKIRPIAKPLRKTSVKKGRAS